MEGGRREGVTEDVGGMGGGELVQYDDYFRHDMRGKNASKNAAE